ncbi:Inosose dehydratase [Aquimixticola soesokkakensis]|uniref:Inosose dehydratase n=1 Tax=Aquimixticola soesokkakensis TaxID=1519096 RepID=A0A1Y5RZW2_9RHOB|nr:sugar phosphate isomerase/epimerase [Aquimixticola soesokkakensis]SLN26445.1 Inosose dehydratase [Aquimixticola soesokkakensis]
MTGTIDHPFSFQLSSSRNFPPLETQLETLAKIGFTNVEPHCDSYAHPAQMRRLLDRFGLSCASGHFNVATLLDRPLACLRIAETLGIKTLVAGDMLPQDRPLHEDDWRQLADRLGALNALLAGKGFRLAWHNHDVELAPLPSGLTPLDILLESGVDWEADVGWIARAGGDPLATLQKHAPHLTLMHLKDVAPATASLTEAGWADPGAGVLDLVALWACAAQRGVTAMIAEHNAPGDYVRFAQTAFAFMEARRDADLV